MRAAQDHGLTMADYVRLRAPYVPEHPRVIFVFESPPASGNYFYKPERTGYEPLFDAMMKDVLRIEPPQNKHEGLRAFADRGFLLLDATYTTVNELREGRARDRIIADGFPHLVEELLTYAEAEWFRRTLRSRSRRVRLR